MLAMRQASLIFENPVNEVRNADDSKTVSIHKSKRPNAEYSLLQSGGAGGRRERQAMYGPLKRKTGGTSEAV